MMNYSCVVIEKEVLVKKAFSKKVEACEYFGERYGEEIAKDRQLREEKILSSIARCEAKSNCILKLKREEELRKLNEERQLECCYYVWSFKTYKKRLFDGMEEMLLRICGVYNAAGGVYEVIEEVYKVVSIVVENVSVVGDVMNKLPDRFKESHVAMFCASRDKMKAEKFSKFIIKIKRQVLKEHLKRRFKA